jgi:hypothetical protein
MSGLKTGNIRAIGNITKCMAMEKYNGLMVESMKANMKTIKSMDMELFIGQMEENI